MQVYDQGGSCLFCLASAIYHVITSERRQCRVFSPTSTAAHASRTIAIAAIKRRNNTCIVVSGSCGRAPISHGAVTDMGK